MVRSVGNCQNPACGRNLAREYAKLGKKKRKNARFCPNNGKCKQAAYNARKKD